jgi:hypothetical protein
MKHEPKQELRQELHQDLTLEDRMLLLERQQQKFERLMQRRFAMLQNSVLKDFDLALEYSRANLSNRCPLSVRQDLDAKWQAREKRRDCERQDEKAALESEEVDDDETTQP